jgi:hypothetical protein
MPREFALGEVFFPTLLVVFLATLVLYAGLTWLLAWLGLYRYIWHPPLFRFALFAGLFAAIAACIYQ